MQNCNDKIKEILRFCIVGGLATVVHYGIYLLLMQWINVSIAYTVGYVLSFIMNFFLSNFFTFGTKPSVKKGFGFAASHLTNYLLHISLLNVFIWLGIDSHYAPIPVLCIVVPINFILVKTSLKKL